TRKPCDGPFHWAWRSPSSTENTTSPSDTESGQCSRRKPGGHSVGRSYDGCGARCEGRGGSSSRRWRGGDTKPEQPRRSFLLRSLGKATCFLRTAQAGPERV